MVNIVGVRFQNAGKLYFFDPNGNWPAPGDAVVVDTSRGMEVGEAVTGVHKVPEEGLTLPLKRVLRVATAQDLEQDQANRAAAREAHAICMHKIEEHRLDMKLVHTQYTLDNTKLIFYFTANGRVDFRSLVKDLASVFHLRIELRQIGVRDEAKMLGGLGPCGRPICCGTFLGDFQPVSIRMAKDQGLSLNPTKISGICGQEGYELTRRMMPRIGKPVETPDGTGTVTDLNIMKERVSVRISAGDSFEVKEYELEALRELNPQLRQRAEAVLSPAEAEEEPAAAKAEKPAPAEAPEEKENEQETAVPAEAVEEPAAQETPAGEAESAAPSWRDALKKAMEAAGENA